MSRKKVLGHFPIVKSTPSTFCSSQIALQNDAIVCTSSPKVQPWRPEPPQSLTHWPQNFEKIFKNN